MKSIIKIKKELDSELKKTRKRDGLREFGGNKEPEKINTKIKTGIMFPYIEIYSFGDFFFQAEIETVISFCQKHEIYFVIWEGKIHITLEN